MKRCLLGVVFAMMGRTPVEAEDSWTVRRMTPSGPVGVCSVEQWKADWPGCRYEDGVQEGHLFIDRGHDGPALRVDYAVGEIGPENGGVGWRYPIANADVAELRYTVRFSRDFDWVKGGKLPGLCGGPESVTGGNRADGRNGFSARLMWRADGRGEAYVYHMHQPQQYGESLKFPADFRFPPDADVRVRLRVALNAPGARDGRLDVWIGLPDAEQVAHVVARSDMEWRSDPNVTIDAVLFETFHGGGDATWAPRRPCSTWFQDVSVAAPQRRGGAVP